MAIKRIETWESLRMYNDYVTNFDEYFDFLVAGGMAFGVGGIDGYLDTPYFHPTHLLANNDAYDHLWNLLGDYSDGYFHGFLGFGAFPATGNKCTLLKWVYDGTFSGGHYSARYGFLRVNADRKLEFELNGSSIAVGSQILQQGKVYHLQIRYKLSATVGIFQVKIDGGPGGNDIDFSGDTRGTLAQTTYRFLDFAGQGNSSGSAVTWDSLVFDDAQYLGVVHVESALADVDGDDNAWTPSSGDRHECVRNKGYTPFSDANEAAGNVSYVYTGNNDDEQGFKFPATVIPANATILGVEFEPRAKMISQGNIAFGVKEGGTKTYKSAQNMGVSYKQYHALWELNPRTSAPWQVTDFDASSDAVQFYLKSGGM